MPHIVNTGGLGPAPHPHPKPKKPRKPVPLEEPPKAQRKTKAKS